MHDFALCKEQVANEGCSIINSVFTKEEINEIAKRIESANVSNDKFRKTTDLFAIRQFLKEVPITDLIFNTNLVQIIQSVFGDDYFMVKSIYFDKPEQSNWFVAFHQDLTISVNKKQEIENFGPWTVKQDQFAVQPPLDILQDIFTIRIHLDDTDEHNGALRIIPGSHLDGIVRVEKMNRSGEVVCKVNAGGVMIMKPLLFHASAKSTNSKKRRVIHLEFSSLTLPRGLDWAEKVELAV